MSRMKQILPISVFSLTVKSLVCIVVGGFNLVAMAADDAPAKEKKPNWASPLKAPKTSSAPKAPAQSVGLLETTDPFATAPPQKTETTKKQPLQKPLPIQANKTRNGATSNPLTTPLKTSPAAGTVKPSPLSLLAEPLPLSRLGQIDFQKPSTPPVRRDPFLKPASGTVLEEGGNSEFAAPQTAPTVQPNSLPFPSDPAPRTTPPESSIFSSTPIDAKPQPAPLLKAQPSTLFSPSPTQELSRPAPLAPSASLQIPQQQVPSPPAPAFQQPQNTFAPVQQQATYNPSTAEPKLLAASSQKTVQEEVHEVQPGENYWTISRQHFGTARYFAALAEYNKHRIPRPDRMKPGMFVLVPDTKILDQRYPKMAGIVDSKPSPESLLPSGFFIGPNGQPLFRIGKGDTLTDIAEKHLGRTARWTQVVGMNRDLLKDGNNLKIGMVLRLPHDASQVALAPSTGVLR